MPKMTCATLKRSPAVLSAWVSAAPFTLALVIALPGFRSVPIHSSIGWWVS